MSRILFAILAIASLSLQAQDRAVGISPVPIWPSDEDTSQFPGHYVFLDLRSAAYVVSYVAPDTGERVTLRFGIHSLIDPKISVHIAADPSGTLHYTYDVANGRYARQAIQKVTLLVPKEDTGIQAQHPVWKSNRLASTVRTVAAPNSSFSPVEWSGSAGEGIDPGSTLAALTVSSTYLPGFTYIVAKGATNFTEYDAKAASALPKEAADQLATVFNQGWDSKRTLTLGPRFSKTASSVEIASNLLFGIHAMVQNKELDGTSPFVQSALSQLSSYLESDDSSSPAAVRITSPPKAWS
jgi:hypothetical protein